MSNIGLQTVDFSETSEQQQVHSSADQSLFRENLQELSTEDIEWVQGSYSVVPTRAAVLNTPGYSFDRDQAFCSGQAVYTPPGYYST